MSTLYKGLCACMISVLILLKMKSVLDEPCKENQSLCFMLNELLSENLFLRLNVENIW